MKTYKVKQITQSCVDGTICNCCGRVLGTCEEIIEVYHHFGYYATIFYDGDEHKIDICEECYAKWIETFKHSPEK